MWGFGEGGGGGGGVGGEDLTVMNHNIRTRAIANQSPRTRDEACLQLSVRIPRTCFLSLAGAPQVSFLLRQNFCRDKMMCLSRQKFCLDKHTFFATKDVFFYATTLLSRQAYFCRDKRRVLSCFVATESLSTDPLGSLVLLLFLLFLLLSLFLLSQLSFFYFCCCCCCFTFFFFGGSA